MVVDGLNQAYVASELVKERDAAMADAMNTFGDFIDDVTTSQHGTRILGEFGLVEPSLDFALAGGHLSL